MQITVFAVVSAITNDFRAKTVLFLYLQVRKACLVYHIVTNTHIRKEKDKEVCVFLIFIVIRLQLSAGSF